MERTAARLTERGRGHYHDRQNRFCQEFQITLLGAFCLLLPDGRSASQEEHRTHAAPTSLGKVEFRVSCSAEAQKSFTRGVAFLDSFTYEESAGAFRDAAAKDPRCAEKGEAYWANQVAILGEEAGGWVAFAEHRTYDALRLLRMAAEHEDATEKHSVTPGAVRPARELLGDLLMEMHQPKEALKAYQQVLGVAPGRRNALSGAAEAERAAGMSRKFLGIRGSAWLGAQFGPNRKSAPSWHRAGKFAAGVELFYLEIERQFTENKEVRIGLELALLESVGEANRGSL